MSRIAPLSLLLGLSFAGCGASSSTLNEGIHVVQPQMAAVDAPSVPADLPSTEQIANENVARAAHDTGVDTKAGSNQVVRRIIYEGELKLAVKDFAVVPDQVERLVVDHEGYVAKSDIDGSSGAARSGNWTVRIPVSRFGSFLQAAGRLGQVVRQTIHSREVTAEFVDAQARAENNRQEEARLLQHLKETATRLNDILTIEKELSRVRGEIEQLEGQLRLLANLSAMSTLTLTVHEVQQFIAPVPFTPPTFGERIATTWKEELDKVMSFGQTLVLLAIRYGLWLLFMAAITVPLLIIATRLLLLVLRQSPIRERVLHRLS